MDQGSKSSLKIVGVIALVAIVGAFGYSSMRSNSLEQSGRVYETPEISLDAPCVPGSISNLSLTPSSTGGFSCSFKQCNSQGTGWSNQSGNISSQEVVTCQNENSGDTGNVNYCIGQTCLNSNYDVDSTNQNTKGDQSAPSTGGTKAAPNR